MSDPTSPSPSAHLEETLGRLSKKPGVKGAMVLDRASGAILKTSGQISSIRKAKPQPQQPEQSSEQQPITDQQGPLSPSFPPGTATDTTTTDPGVAPGTAVTTTGEEAIAAQPTMVSSGTGMDGDVHSAGAGSGVAATGSAGSSSSSAAVSAYDQNVVELAAMVWSFVSNAGEFVQELDGEDELKLLRLRTKKQELVIVPDAKYLLVVFHDTPPA
ncbi:hypothetical protein QBC45DRAFT_3368 [Copromyces sp. CBS 386.78]|nr:hypothetical protein QBC45DRAFT_3368 [Copromyces sp. CBS 386.78]